MGFVFDEEGELKKKEMLFYSIVLLHDLFVDGNEVLKN